MSQILLVSYRKYDEELPRAKRLEIANDFRLADPSEGRGSEGDDRLILPNDPNKMNY